MAHLSGVLITPGETLNFYLGSSPSKENISQDSISFDWNYQTPGKYEIRIKYLVSFEKAKFIFSNTEIFEVIDYQGIDKIALKSLQDRAIPHFFFFPEYYNVEHLSIYIDNIKEVCLYVINNYETSRFSPWIKLYMASQAVIESKFNLDNATLEKSLNQLKSNKNPFIHLKADFLLGLLKKQVQENKK